MARQVILVPSYLDQVNEYVHRLGGPLGTGIPHHDIMLVEIGSNDVRARVWQCQPSAAPWFAHHAALQCVLAATWPDLTAPCCKATACSHIETAWQCQAWKLQSVRVIRACVLLRQMDHGSARPW